MENHLLKNGKELIIRTPKIEETNDFLNYLNHCGKETDFLGFGKEGVEQTLEDEIKYFQNFTGKNFMLIALIDNKIVGSCSLSANEKRVRLNHIGILGITVLKDYWNLGIGKYLIETTIERGKNNGLTRIELTTRVDNERALSLYKKLGFEIEGQLKNSIYIDDRYYDSYIMGLIL